MSIRTRLIFNSAMAVGVALLIAGAVLAFYEYREQRRSFADVLEIRSQILANSVQAALEFDDVEAAGEVLASQSVDPAIRFAAIFRNNGKLFTQYPPSGSSQPTWSPLGQHFGESSLTSAIDVQSGSETLGRVVLCYDLSPILRSIQYRTFVLIATLIAAMAAAVLVAGRLQSVVSTPISQLTDAAVKITDEGDYSVRVDRHRDDEIGVLTDAFNGMLNEVHVRDDALRRSRDELEDRVRARTADLEEAMQEANDANRAKTDFLANMSHEIRTPMNAILGYAELMMDPEQSSEERIESAAVIQRNGKHLLAIIDDILDISKIEAGRMSVEQIECSPWQVLEEVGSFLNHRAEDKGLQLRLEHAGPVPKWIRSDPTRMRQILFNLVGNAIKFTDSGSVRVVMDLIDPAASGDEPRLRCRVIDTGVGLTSSEQGNLFQAFTQADETVTRKFGGTGLGLVISQRLAQLLGGDITVVSEKGKGSTFTVELATGSLEGVELCEVPRTPAASPGASAVTLGVSLPEVVRVLLVEDGPDNQRLISFVLQKAGAEVEIAENGRIGHDRALAAWHEGRPFAVTLMDMQMPVLDGYSATAMLRELGYPFPIIALTAHAMDGDRERCLSAGCDDYMTKPIDRGYLICSVGEWAERHDQTYERWSRSIEVV